MNRAAGRRGTLAYAFLVAGALAVWGGGLANPFCGDDAYLLHEYLRAQAEHPPLGAYFTTVTWGVFFRPLAAVFNYLLFALSWPATWPMHLLALCVLAAGAAGVARLARACNAGAPTAWLAAAIFLTLPAHAEPVLWIASLHGMVEGTLTIWAVVLLVEGRRAAWNTPRVAGGLALFVLAVFTKESGAVALGIVLVHDVVFRRELAPAARDPRRLAAVYGPMLVTVVAYALLRQHAFQGYRQTSINTFDLGYVAAAVTRTMTACFSPVVWHGVESLLRPLTRGTALWRLGLVAVACVPFAAAIHRRSRAGIWLWLSLGGVLAPLVAVAVVPAERHLYVPSAFAAVLLALGAARLMRGTRRTSLAAACVVVLWLGLHVWTTRGRVRVWTDAAGHANAVLTQTENLLPRVTPDTLLLYLEVPDQVQGALVFRFGNLGEFLRARYGEPGLQAHMVATPRDVTVPMLGAPGAVQFTLGARGGYLYWPDAMHGGAYARHDRDLIAAGLLEQSDILSNALARGTPLVVFAYDAAQRQLRVVHPDIVHDMAGHFFEVGFGRTLRRRF